MWFVCFVYTYIHMIQTHAWRVYRSSIWRSYVSYVSVSSYVFMKCTCLCMLAYSCLHNNNIYFVHCLTRIEKWTAFVFICHWMRVFQTSSIWVLLNFTSTWKYIKLVSNIFRKVLKYSHIVLVHTLNANNWSKVYFFLCILYVWISVQLFLFILFHNEM